MSSVSQSSNTGAASGALWWKVGEFVAPAGTGQRLRWQTCSTNCYKNVGPGQVSIGVYAEDPLTQTKLSNASVRVYSDFVTF